MLLTSDSVLPAWYFKLRIIWRFWYWCGEGWFRGARRPGPRFLWTLWSHTSALTFGTSMASALNWKWPYHGEQGAGPVMAWSPFCILRECCILNPGIAVPCIKQPVCVPSWSQLWWCGWQLPPGSPCYSEPKVSLLSLYFRSACQHLNTRWKRPSPSRQVRTKCAVSAWKWSSRRHLPLRGDLGFSPTAITRTACPASDSGGVPSSSRTQSLSKYSNES